MGEVCLVGAVGMTGMAVWRLPALWYREPLRRAVWACCAAFAVALWCRVPAVKSAMDESAVTDLSALVKYMASMLALLAILSYISAVHGAPPSGQTARHAVIARQVSRVAHVGAWGAILTMVILFFAAIDRSEPSTDFATDHAGEWGASLFMTIMYGYLATSAATASFQWGRAASRSDTWPMRIGLALMAAAALLYFVYPVMRIGTIYFPTGASATTMRAVADGVNLAVATLFAVGVGVPSTKALITRWTTARTLIRLHPLWRELTGAFPDLAFQRPGSLARELLRLSPPMDVRLDRWTQEIADAVEQLRHHATADLLDAAEEATDENHDDPPAAAEALWIKAALHSAREGRRNAVASPGLPEKPLTDSVAEAHWLTRVQRAYASIPEARVAETLRRAGRPGPGEELTA